MRFEIMRQSWFKQGRATGLEPPGEGSYFNQEELRWEINIMDTGFLDVIQGLCQKEDAGVKIIFPPTEAPKTELPIIEILDAEEG